jgi:hypothetical protein
MFRHSLEVSPHLELQSLHQPPETESLILYGLQNKHCGGRSVQTNENENSDTLIILPYLEFQYLHQLPAIQSRLRHGLCQQQGGGRSVSPDECSDTLSRRSHLILSFNLCTSCQQQSHYCHMASGTSIVEGVPSKLMRMRIQNSDTLINKTRRSYHILSFNICTSCQQHSHDFDMASGSSKMEGWTSLLTNVQTHSREGLTSS